MRRLPLVFVSLFVVILLQFFHILALRYHLYWFLWWYDIPIHIMGGMVSGFLIIWLFSSSDFFKLAPSRKLVFRYTVFFTLVIGTLWEIFEYSIGNTFNSRGSYPLDTVIDILSDFIGALIALVYDYFYRKNDRQIK